MSGKRGDVNGWTCDTCGGVTMAIHVDDGTTPMFLGCRANGLDPFDAARGVCPGRATSMMYPAGPMPDGFLAMLIEFGWEWYRPEGAPSLDEIAAGRFDRRPKPRTLRGIVGRARRPIEIDTGSEYARLDGAMREHVDKGGLVLRRLTDAGRDLLPARAAE